MAKIINLKLEKSLNQEKLISEIEKIVKRANVSYTDAIIHYCHKNNQEIETVGEVLKKNGRISAILQKEFEDVNMLPKTSRLPI